MSRTTVLVFPLADLDAGKLSNTATILGTDPTGAAVSSPATATMTAVKVSDMGFSKTSSPTLVKTVGEMIKYSFAVSNTGNVTMASIKVTDPMSGLSAVTCPVTSLAPGASTTCTANYVVTQADLDRGTIPNTATMMALDPQGGSLTRTSSATTNVTQTAAL